jgi:signal transduction histidine kinase
MNSLLAAQRTRRTLFLVLASMAGFVILGYGANLMMGQVGRPVSPIWPATAFGLCLILRQARNRRDTIVMLTALLAASLLVSALASARPAFMLGFSLINMLEIVAGLMAMRVLGNPRVRDLVSGLRFGLAAGVIPSLTGALCSGLLVALMGGDAVQAGQRWFLSNLLGACLVFPLGMSVSLRQFAKLRLQRRFLEALGVFAALTVFSLLAFRAPGGSLDYLVLFGALIATARFRLLGAGAGLIIIAAIALASPAMHSGDVVMHIEWLQLFLGLTSLICVRCATVLNERDMHLAASERRRRGAVRAARFKSQLLAHVNKEVKGPLSAIIGFSGMLESGNFPVERAHEFAHVITHNGELLQRLHDDLFDLSRAGTDALSMTAERVPLQSTLQNCIDGLNLEIELGGKAVLLEDMEAGLAVHADPVRLAQVINNLIANAYKYGDNFSPIHVRAQRLADGYGRIEIANAGPGILSHERHSLFRPFVLAESTGRRVPGAGLGLSMAKLLVEKQGGRIDFESVPGRQTRFWIDLPLAA